MGSRRGAQALRTLLAASNPMTSSLGPSATIFPLSMTTVPDAIWFGRPWSFVMKGQFDALLYALLTAGVFGWMWPVA